MSNIKALEKMREELAHMTLKQAQSTGEERRHNARI